MARFSCVALLASAAFIVSDAFISPQVRWVPTSMSARQQGQRFAERSLAARKATPFLPKTAKRATASDDDVTAAEAATPKSPSTSVPEDLDYYDGLLGQQPGANKAMRDVEGEGSSTSDYPIPLPSYLLLVLATVASIAFTGSIFEVTGGHPELGYTATYIIGTLSLPSFIFLFYAAIKKGKAEVEEDDANFRQGRW
ncbi:unnamed protein product [Pylaiella littoralis]